MNLLKKKKKKKKKKGIERYRWDDSFHNTQGNMQRIENMVRRPRQLASLQVEMMAYHFPFFEKKKKKKIVSVTIGYFYRHI